LQDRWKEIEVYTKDGIELSRKSAEFMKKQAAIESEYAKNMLKLVKSFQLEEPKRKAKREDASSPLQEQP